MSLTRSEAEQLVQHLKSALERAQQATSETAGLFELTMSTIRVLAHLLRDSGHDDLREQFARDAALVFERMTGIDAISNRPAADQFVRNRTR